MTKDQFHALIYFFSFFGKVFIKETVMSSLCSPTHAVGIKREKCSSRCIPLHLQRLPQGSKKN